MSAYIPASLKEAHDRLETAQQEYYVAYEKAHPSFEADRSWFRDFLKRDVVEAIESGNPRFYAQVAVECMIALNTHTSAARLLGQCVDADLNEEPIVSFGAAGPLRRVAAALHGGVLALTWTFDDKRNEGEEVVAVLRIPVTPSALVLQRSSDSTHLSVLAAAVQSSSSSSLPTRKATTSLCRSSLLHWSSQRRARCLLPCTI